MLASRMGSLNSLEQEKGNKFWKRWLGRRLPSADTMGRVPACINLDEIRALMHDIYSQLKRNKALKKSDGLELLIIDGHEINASYLRCCAGCLERTMHFDSGDRIQYYHRCITAALVFDKFTLLLDAEEQRKGEDEGAAAKRLLNRIMKMYPRAFYIVAGDGLYLRADFFKLAKQCGKNFIAVLKDERRDLMQDARGIFSSHTPLVEITGKLKKEIWDIEGFTSWESLGEAVRVIKSVETSTIKRQLAKKEEEKYSEWIWATTLLKRQVSTTDIVNVGHERWLIENKAFNEMVTHWHADHIYKHNPNAIMAFWLILMLVINLFRAFVCLNIKPEYRNKHTSIYFSDLIFAGLHNDNELLSLVDPP